MKKLLILSLILTASTAYSAGFLQQDASQQTKIQGFSPNGLYSALLTVNSTTIDGNNRLALSIYSPIDAKIRLMATSSKTGSISHTLIGGQRTVVIINKATPFVNISGATGGDYMGM